METNGTPRDKKALQDFFDWILNITKKDQSTFVFLVSSEEFFYFWIKRHISYIKRVFTIGNLSKAGAQVFFENYVLQIIQDQNMPIPFSELYKITGLIQK